jgi:hypothetical protein
MNNEIDHVAKWVLAVSGNRKLVMRKLGCNKN